MKKKTIKRIEIDFVCFTFYYFSALLYHYSSRTLKPSRIWFYYLIIIQVSLGTDSQSVSILFVYEIISYKYVD